MLKNQRTIAKEVSCSGTGLHTGSEVKATFKPSGINTGVTFVRTDLPMNPEIPADIDHVVDTSRGTTIGIDNAKVHTVEHLLAALAGLGIDNVTVEISSSEPPVGDGSAMIFVESLQKAGFVEQDSPKDYIIIEEMIRYSEPDGGPELVVLPSDDFKVTFMSAPDTPAVEAQYTGMFSLEDEFIVDYAPARTFCLLSELKTLREQNLIRGGSLSNALVIADVTSSEEELDELKDLFGITEQVTVGQNGLINGVELRFPNEFCRHKVLDLTGDLFLLGAPIRGHVMAVSSGHRSNIEFATMIRKIYEKRKIAKEYDHAKSDKFLFDIRAIRKIMPHRYPFLMIDRIIYMLPGEKVVGIKNVTINEQFFTGHFPTDPVMPAVLQIEAMAQVGGILFLSTVDDPEKKLVYFLGVDKAKFRKPVVPGDQIRFELDMIRLRRTTCKMQGKACVDGDLVAEAELTAMLVDKENPPH